MKPLSLFHTANAAEQGDMQLSETVCTSNIAGVADGAWALIAPYGEHSSPDGRYVQKFDRAQGDKVVETWNSITGTAARLFKNLWHGLGPKYSAPTWEGHPDDDKARWPKEKLLAEITELRTSNAGLEGRVKWNAKGMAERVRGPLFPSVRWWHWPPSGEPPAVYPELLESVGLWPHVNIPGLPAWTANTLTTLAGTPQAETQDQNNIMNPEQLAALRKALNLPDTADAATIISTANSALQLTTANATLADEKADTETKLRAKHAELTTANAAVKSLTDERDELTTANTALLTEREALIKGVLDLAEKKGAITPAERPDYATRLSTANTAAAAIAELPGRKAMNTQSVELNGTRLDISTANAREGALTTAVEKEMKDNGGDYDKAFAAVKANPTFAPLFGAMQDPTKKAA